MTEKMIQVMHETGDYPKAKLNNILATHSGEMLAYEVSMLFAKWTLEMKIPESKHKYYTDKDQGEWISWVQ